MKWLLTLIIGAVLGAVGLFVYLRQVPHAPAPAAVVTPGATALPPPAPGQNSATVIDGQLPAAPVVTPDLTEADLPVRPNDPVPLAPVAGSTDIPAGKLMVPVDGIAFSQLTDT